MTRICRSNLSISLAFVFALSFAGSASAQNACFTVGSEAERAQHVVGIDTVVRLSASCEYAATARGPFVAPGALASRDTDFLEVYQLVASAPNANASGDPRLVVARPARGRRGADEVQHTLLLRYCAHYLLEEQLGFRVTPEAGGERFRVQRAPGGEDCGGAQVELRAVRGAGDRLYGGAVEQTLGLAQSSLVLPAGDWSIYAARPGAVVALRVGVFRSQRTVTPLANHLRSVGLDPADEASVPPLFAARWDVGSPGLLLHPTNAAMTEELLWPELRTAADAGLLWLATRGEGTPTVIAPLQLEATEVPAVRLPDGPVRDEMRRAYGEAGDALAPTPSDWRSVFDHLAVCLTPSYHEARGAEIGGPVPDPGMCAALGGLAILAQAEEATPARFCIQHGMQIIGARGARQDLGEEECFPLPAPESADRPPYRIAIAGDRIKVEGPGLCVLLDNRQMTVGEGGAITLDRSGLLEIRQSGGEGCTSVQSIARLRLPVLDPERDWHPVGLYTSADPERLQCSSDDERRCPWRALDHDENEIFAFVEPRHELEFRLSTSPQVAAAINADHTSTVQLGQDVPVLSGVRGRFEGAREEAIVALISRDGACPSSETTYAEVRERAPIDVDDMQVDATFHALLLAVESDDRPVQCLARASFRMRPSRAIAALTVEDFLGLELGLLGDTQLVFFANEPYALGFMLPLVWFRLTPGQRWVALEVSGNLVLGAGLASDPDPGAGISHPALSRVGVSLSWALSLGVPDYVPRLLQIGGMLHGAAETYPDDAMGNSQNPIVSFFVSLNLATLIDLAGGR
jgi:hypothetical protein